MHGNRLENQRKGIGHYKMPVLYLSIDRPRNYSEISGGPREEFAVN